MTDQAGGDAARISAKFFATPIFCTLWLNSKTMFNTLLRSVLFPAGHETSVMNFALDGAQSTSAQLPDHPLAAHLQSNIQASNKASTRMAGIVWSFAKLLVQGLG